MARLFNLTCPDAVPADTPLPRIVTQIPPPLVITKDALRESVGVFAESFSEAAAVAG